MRGQVALSINVPNKGLVANVPNYQAPPDSLVAGSNVYIDEDGLLKCRQGYAPVGVALSPVEPVTGIVGYRDQSGVFQEVVGTTQRWQKYNGDGTFTDISGGNLLTGDVDNPVRFTPFAQGGQVWVYGINNVNELLYWNSSLPAYVAVGPASEPIATATESGTTVTITMVGALPFGLVVGGPVTISGVSVAGYNGTWTVTAVAGPTFQYTAIASSLGPGTGGTAINETAGAPFTTARDITVLANRVLVVNTLENGTRYSTRVRWSEINDGTTWVPLAVNDMLDANDAIVGIQRTSRVSAIIYRDLSAWLISAYPGNDASAFTTERISVVDNMTGPCSPAAIVVAEGYHFYLGQDGRVYQYDGNTIYPISDPIDPVVRPMLNTAVSDRTCGTYLPDKRSILFFFPGNNDTEPYNAVMYSIRRQAFEPVMTFADAISAAAVVEESNGLTWNDWVGPTVQWVSNVPGQQIPFATWNDIPQSLSLNCWTGTPDAYVNRFFSAQTDNGIAISYSATWPPMRQDPTQNVRVADFEIYLQQSTDPEVLSAAITGLLQPYTTPPLNIVSIAIQLNDQTTFQMPIEPGPLDPANVAVNFVQFAIQSAGYLAEFVFGGATLFLNAELRGSGYGTM